MDLPRYFSWGTYGRRAWRKHTQHSRILFQIECMLFYQTLQKHLQFHSGEVCNGRRHISLNREWYCRRANVFLATSKPCFKAVVDQENLFNDSTFWCHSAGAISWFFQSSFSCWLHCNFHKTPQWLSETTASLSSLYNTEGNTYSWSSCLLWGIRVAADELQTANMANP